MSDLVVFPNATAQATFGVFTVLGTIGGFAQIFAIWRRRHDPIIKNRGFASLMIIHLGCFLCFLSLGLGGSFNLPCFMYPLALALLMFMFLFTLERIVVIYLLYIVTLKTREYAKDNLGFDNLTLEDQGHLTKTGFEHRFQEWLFRNRTSINTTDFFCKLKVYEYMCGIFTGVAVFALFYLLNPSALNMPFLSDECISTGQQLWRWLMIMYLGILPLWMVLPVKLKQVKENYFALKEFTAFAKFAVVCVVSIPIHAFYPRGVAPPRTLYYLWVMSILQTAIFIFGGYVLILLRKAKYWEKSSRRMTNNNSSHASSGFSSANPNSPKERLVFFLTDIDGFRALEQFLCKEFSVENGYFFNSVEKYKRKCMEMKDSFNPRTEARKIFNEYCSENASLCINIASEVRRKITGVLNEEKNIDDATFIHETLKHFSDAQAEVFDLILRDSFRRFNKSQEYKDYQARFGPEEDEQPKTATEMRSTKSQESP